MNTFNSFCIAACIFMIFIGMASVVVNSLDVFPSSPDINTDDAQGKFNTGYIQIAAFGASIALAIVFSALSRSTNIIGIWIFGAVFWASWLSVNSMFYTGGFLNNTTGIALVAMLWLGMIVMFIGAVTGMMHGSIWMK